MNIKFIQYQVYQYDHNTFCLSRKEREFYNLMKKGKLVWDVGISEQGDVFPYYKDMFFERHWPDINFDLTCARKYPNDDPRGTNFCAGNLHLYLPCENLIVAFMNSFGCDIVLYSNGKQSIKDLKTMEWNDFNKGMDIAKLWMVSYAKRNKLI